MIDTIIFDFDGTLADTFPIVLKNMDKVCRELGIQGVKYTPELKDLGARELIKKFGIRLWKVPKFVKKAKSMIKADLLQARIFKGIKPVLKELKKHYKIGILTSNDEGVVQSILDREGIKVNFIYTDKSLFGKHKKLKRLMKAFKLKKDEIVYVGDEVRDAQACKKAGVPIMAVTWGYNSRTALAKETKNLINKPEELLRLVPIAAPAKKKAA